MKAKTLVSLLVIAIVAMTCLPFLPTNLGGSATYVATHGTSMIPRFHAGDIAVVKPTSKYRVGDIAAYHSDTLHGAVVLHRIIAIEGGHFTFKGDNNNFIDVDHPTADRLVGKLKMRIPHGGQIRTFFITPFVLIPLITVALVGLVSGLFLKKRRQRKPARSRVVWSRRAAAPRPRSCRRTRGCCPRRARLSDSSNRGLERTNVSPRRAARAPIPRRSRLAIPRRHRKGRHIPTAL